MPQPMTLASDTAAPSSTSTVTRREACLRSQHAHLYPGVHPGIWEVAAMVVDRIIAARLLGGGSMAVQGRVLSDDHFEFRGGTEAGVRPGGKTASPAGRITLRQARRLHR